MSSLGSSDARSSCIVMGYQQFGFPTWKAPNCWKGWEMSSLGYVGVSVLLDSPTWSLAGALRRTSDLVVIGLGLCMV